MANILILGANGQIARLAIQQLLSDGEDHHLTLFLRNASRLANLKGPRVDIIDGDAADATQLEAAMAHQDVVYANLAGHNIETQAKAVVTAMDHAQIKRLIWISTLGIYDEVPGNFGKWNHQMLDNGYLPTYAAAAKAVEDSDLDYTIIRPAWLSNEPSIDYEITHRNDTFKGTEVSRASIAALVVDLVDHPDKAIRDSLGVNKPGTDGDKPSFE